jgi:hypothetical protein
MTDPVAHINVSEAVGRAVASALEEQGRVTVSRELADAAFAVVADPSDAAALRRLAAAVGAERRLREELSTASAGGAHPLQRL